MKFVLRLAAEIGARRVVMCSEQEMHVAHRLYARLGFGRLPERDWEPVPGVMLLALGVTTKVSRP